MPRVLGWLTLLAFTVGSAHTTHAEPTTVQVRVLSYNIHHGAGTDGELDLPRIANVIRRLKPDLVALQEVDKKTQRSRGVDQAAELGRLTGMHAVFGKAIMLFLRRKSANHAVPWRRSFNSTGLAPKSYSWVHTSSMPIPQCDCVRPAS
jgi:endonuclease/exonuclease/phosphatase family metal-dependent hydrolase